MSTTTLGGYRRSRLSQDGGKGKAVFQTLSGRRHQSWEWEVRAHGESFDNASPAFPLGGEIRKVETESCLPELRNASVTGLGKLGIPD